MFAIVQTPKSSLSNGRSLSYWIQLIWTVYLPSIVPALTLSNPSFCSKKKIWFCKSISALWSFLSLDLKLAQYLKASVRLGQHKLLVLWSTLYCLSACTLLHWDKHNFSQKSLHLYPDTNRKQAVHSHTVLYICNLWMLTVAWNSYFRFNIDHFKSYSHMPFLDSKNWQRFNSEFHTLPTCMILKFVPIKALNRTRSKSKR